MNGNLDWFERVFEQLQDLDSYNYDKSGPLMDALYECIIFREKLGDRHPIIELYDFDDEVRIAHICFDTANQQFYLPVYDDFLDQKMHVLIDSFEEIQSMFVNAWNRNLEILEDDIEDDENKMLHNIGNEQSTQSLFHNISTLFMQQQQHEMDKDKLENIEWLEEEELISSLKIDHPTPIEQQMVLRLGVIHGTNERVLCKETRFLNTDEITHGSSQVFLINQEELLPLVEMVKKHFI